MERCLLYVKDLQFIRRKLWVDYSSCAVTNSMPHERLFGFKKWLTHDSFLPFLMTSPESLLLHQYIWHNKNKWYLVTCEKSNKLNRNRPITQFSAVINPSLISWMKKLWFWIKSQIHLNVMVINKLWNYIQEDYRYAPSDSWYTLYTFIFVMLIDTLTELDDA